MLNMLARTVRADASCTDDNALNQRFFAGVSRVVEQGRLAQEASCLQHGTTSVLLHSIAVAYWCERAAVRMNRTEHLDELRRAALLHDYFLYDWHVSDPAHSGHALLHASRACKNAREDFADLTDREANSIACHMFPITPLPPRYVEGWLVTGADKVCASYETACRVAPAYPALRSLCAHYLPGLVLSSISGTGGGSDSHSLWPSRPPFAAGM